MTLKDVKLILLPKILDERGSLTFIEGGNHIPFKIERTYMVYDVPGGGIRGGHAYQELSEFIIALSGSFDVVLDDGNKKRTYTLNRSYYGLFVPKLIWRSLENFSTNSLCMILASEKYNEDDYLRDYQQFKQLK